MTGKGVLALCLAVAVGTSAAPDPGAADAPAVVTDADARYQARDFEGALAILEPAAGRDSNSYDLWWRIARSRTDRGQRAEYDDDRKTAETAYGEAVRAARRATVLEPDAKEGHLHLALALGRLALVRGGKEKVRLAKEVKAEADRTLALDKDMDFAHHVLGRWNREIVTLSPFQKAFAKVLYGGVPPGASLDNSVAHLERAVELRPEHVNHRLELAKTYLALDLKSKAREQLERALALPVSGPFDAEYKAEASRLLQKTEK